MKINDTLTPQAAEILERWNAWREIPVQETRTGEFPALAVARAIAACA